MHPNNDLNPENFKIFSIEELSVIAYNLYLRDEKTLKKHWKEPVKQIICKSLQDNNISSSSSALEITLVLNQDCKRSNNLLINKNLLCSLAPKMLKAHEHIG